MIRDEDLVPEELIAAPGRRCGDCTLCCKLLLVSAPDEGLEKPQGEWCEHSCDRGCRIYELRPKPCVTFQCLWLNGALEERDRPDRNRLVICLEKSVGKEMKDRDGKVIARDLPVWCVYEAWPGVVNQARSQKILGELEKMVVREKDNPDQWAGPFPILIIPSATGLRRMKWPNSNRWVPCLRPHETEAQFGLDRNPAPAVGTPSR